MKIEGKYLTEQLRSALRTCNISNYKIDEETGIDQGTLSKFRTGKGDLGRKNIDRLAHYLGLKLVKR